MNEELTPSQVIKELEQQSQKLNKYIDEIKQCCLCIQEFEITLGDYVALIEQLEDRCAEVVDTAKAIFSNRQWLDFLQLESTF